MEKDILTSNDKTESLRDIYENSFANKSNNNINNKLKSNKESKESIKTDSFTVEELKNYYFNFTSKYKEIMKSAEILKNDCVNSLDSTLKEKYNLEIVGLEKEISNLKVDFDNNSMFLVSHDRNNYLNLIDELMSEIDQIKLILNPKKKFKFSNRKTENDNDSSVKVNQDIKVKKEVKNFYSEQDLVIENIKDQRIVQEVLNKANLFIDDVSNSVIIFKNSFKSLFIRNFKNSLLIVPLIGGGTHVTGCDSCEIYISTHQLRIHHCINTSFYIHTSSDPIIEFCSKLIFGDLQSILKLKSESESDDVNVIDIIKKILSNDGLNSENNKYANIQDFQWLKNEKSPNFDIVSEIDFNSGLNKRLFDLINNNIDGLKNNR
jgi:hypothetical protein